MHRNTESSANNKKQANYEHLKQFHKDKKLENKQELKLQSCEKVKHNLPEVLHRAHLVKNLQNEEKEILTFTSKEQYTYKIQTERLINLLMAICSPPSQSTLEHQNIRDIINSFARQLQSIFDKYIQKFQSFQLIRDRKEEFNKKVILYIDETFKKQFINIGDSATERQKNTRELSSQSHDSSASEQNVKNSIKSSKMTPPTSEFHYQHKTIQRGPISKIEQSFNQVNKLLEKVVQPRFVRKSGLLSNKRSREESSSVEEIMQRSIQQRKKRDHSNSNSKQTLYKINRLLNQ